MKGRSLRPVAALLIVFALFLFAPALPLKSAAIPALAYQNTQDQSPTTNDTRDPEANLPYLFSVFAITWVAFFAYLYYLSQRQQTLRMELQELREALPKEVSQGQSQLP